VGEHWLQWLCGRSQVDQHCKAMLFRLTAVNDGRLVGRRDTRTVIVGPSMSACVSQP